MLPLILLAATLRVGEPAPEIQLDRLLPPSASVSALRGKAVVLEFWATWCGPCVAGIPDWNQLVEVFRDKPVIFLSVTDESPGQVEKFLQKTPIEGWVGIARRKAMHDPYEINGIPRAVLIDASGKLAGTIYTPRLNPTIVEQLIANKPLERPGSDKRGTQPALEISVRPTLSTEGRFGIESDRDRLAYRAAMLRILISQLWDVPMGRISGERSEDRTLYDISVTLPGAGRDLLKSLARTALESALALDVQRETRETDAWVLTAPNRKPAGLKETESPGGGIMSSAGRNSVGLRNGQLETLAQLLERASGKPVIDETGLGGRYDVKLKWEDDAGLQRAVRELGLELALERRRLDYLAVASARR
jgi:uncharacterized protein (TIGR03435 family)